MQAPSAFNTQPWEFIVVTNEDLINKFRLFEQITIPFNKRIFNNYVI